MIKYLYYKSKMFEGVSRSLVVKETESDIFIKHYHDSEVLTRVPKKDYIVVGPFAYQTILYEEETPELLEEYKATMLRKEFLRKLKDLQDCKDKGIMTKVVNIRWEE